MAKEYKFGFVIEGDYKSAVAALQKTQQELDRLEKQTGKTKKTQDTWSDATETFGKKLGSMRTMVIGLAGTLGATMSINYFAGLIKQSIDAADHLNDLSKTTKLSVETLSGLKLASQQTGTDLEKTAKGIAELAKRMGENADSFKAMGITAKEPLEAFKQLADIFASTTDVQERNKLANDALGKSWQDLAPLLAEGSANIQKMVDTGARLSNVTTEAAERADEFNDNLELLKATSGGLAMSITSALLPALTSTTEWFLQLMEPATYVEIKLGQITKRIQEQTEALGDMTLAQVDADLQGTWEKIRNLKDEIASLPASSNLTRTALSTLPGGAILGTLFGKNAGAELAILNEELAELENHYAAATQRLAELEGRAKPAAKALEGVTSSTSRLAKEAKTLSVNWALIRQNWSEFESDSTAMAAAIGTVTTRTTRLSDSAKLVTVDWGVLRDHMNEVGKENAEVTAAMIEDWQNVRQSFGEFFADLVLEGGNAFDALLKSWERTALQMAGNKLFDMGASLLGIKAPGGAGASAGSLFSSAISGIGAKILPSLFGGAATAGTGVAAAGSASSVIGAYSAGGSAAATAAGAGGAGIMGSLGTVAAAIPVWGWAAMAAAAIAAIASKESTPSWNAGFLTDPSTSLGKSGQSFQTAAFASGFAPTGFYRRSSQAEAEQVIDVFRQLDETIVSMGRTAGLSVTLSNLRGLNETLLAGTSGSVFGSGGEKGKPGMALEQQLQMFASQLIESLRGQIDDRDLDMILAAGGVDQMIAKLEEVLTVQEAVVTAQQEASDAIEKTIQAERDLAKEREDGFQSALGAARNYIDALQQAHNAAIREQQDAVRDRYREQLQIEESLHNRRLSLFRSLMDYTASLKTGDLTILNPRDQLAFAQSQFRGLAGTALNTGLSMEQRLAAAEGLQGSADAYLRAGRGVYASSGGYKDIFNEVLGSLDAAKFLGTNSPFQGSATQVQLENAMLAELQKLNAVVLTLPPNIAASLKSIMTGVVTQGVVSNYSPVQLANTIASTTGTAGMDAAADPFKTATGRDIYEAATDSAEAAAVRDYVNQNYSSERAAVEAAVQRFKDDKLTVARLEELGLTGASGRPIRDILAEYNIPVFHSGTDYVPRTGFAYLEQGERVVTASDNRGLSEKLDKVASAVERLVSIEMARAERDSRDMAENNRLLAEGNKRSAIESGSRKYASA